jgi:uncharacterized membrane-anchored protein YhcB (DUF1043 family)
MSFAILRHAKIKSSTKGAAISHNHRLSDEAKINIDKARSHLNVYIEGPGAKDRIDAKVPEKHRKDAVIAVEILLTSGPEFFDQIEADREKLMVSPKFKAWVSQSIEWAKKEFGANLVDAVLHMDESTPHIHILTVPLTVDGRLCAKEVTSRDKMQRRQTDYAKAMKQFGLERGTPAIETKRRHIGLKEAAGSGGKAARDAKAQADLLAKAQGELERVKGELARATAEAQHAVAKATATARAEAQGVLEKVQGELEKSKVAMTNQQKLNIENFHLINKINDEGKKMDAYSKNLQAELATSNEKLALALDEKAAALRALVQSGEKSNELLKTIAGHEASAEQLRKMEPDQDAQAGMAWWNGIDEKSRGEWLNKANSARPSDAWEAAKADQEAQEAFAVKWAGLREASRSERALKVVDVCGRQVVYALGRGNFAVHTFEQGEVMPNLNLNEQQKNGVQR